MKKITLLLCVFLFSFSGYSQFGPEGFENTAGPEPTPATNWTLGTGEWAVFDNGVGLDPRWDIINGTVAPLPALVHGGTTAAFMTIGNNGAGQISKDYLATPLFTVPANGQLRFWTRMFTPGNQNTIFKVGIATATANQINPAQYSFIQQWSEVQLQDTAPTVDTWIEKVVDIPATYPAGTQIYLVFSREYAQGATQTAIGGDRWLIDDVKVVSRCLDMPLASLTATNIALTTASLNWDNPSGATSWEIEIVGAAALPTGVGTVYNGIRPYPATGLTPNTNYKYYVRSICSNGALSNWIGPLNFTTLRPGLTCIAPITVPSIPYSTNDNTALYADLTDAIQGSSCGAVPAGTNFMGGNDVFYTFTPTFTGNVIVAMTPNAGVSNASMFIYQGCANVGLTCVGGVANSGTGVRKVPFLPVTAGTTYTIVLSSSVGTQAYSYGLTIQQEFCLPPQNLVVGTPIGTTTASLSWANQTGSTATSWQVAVTPAGAGIPTGPGTTTTINTNYLATGLTSGTNYQYYVRSDCGNGTFSSWTGPVQFQTALCPVSQQCNYTFIQTDAASNGWTGNVMQVKQNGIVVATLNGPTGTSGAAGSTLSTTVALCDTLPFELFWTVGGTNSTDVGISIVNSFGQTIKTKPAGVGTNNSIVYSGVVNCITPACIAPINLTATAISNTSATLGWFTAGPETSWQVLVVPRGTPAPTAATVGWQTATTNPFIYTPLISGTNYTFYVRPVCSPTNVGDWSDGLNFTSSICPLANKCNYQFLMSDSASNGWGSTMSVVQNGIVVATLSGPTTGNATLNQNVSLCDGIQFQVIWNTGGTGTPSQVGLQIKEALAPQGIIYTLPLGSVQSNTTPLFETVAICTPPSCPRPTMLAISLTGSTTTTVGWNENGSATEWEVIYLPFGSTPPLPTALGLLTTSNPVQLSGLLPGTTYTIYVRSKCSPTNTSFWSNGITLTTTPGNDNCANALNTPVNSAAACDQTVFGTISGATASALPAIVSPCIGAPDDDIWFKFNATNSYLQITLRDVISTSTLGGNLNFAVYSGNCGALVNPPIFCSIANVLSGVVNGMTVGQTYYVRVYSNAATPQNATFNLCITTPSTCENSTVLCGTSGITYGNTTGVESLGQIGCLFTSPNPRYFKIKIINSGPVNLQISQTLTSTGLGADVDYIAWGPFTTAVNICNGISVPFTAPIASTNPLNLTGQQNPAQTGGCSYSGNPIEFWDIENAVAGQYYVLMVTNFSNNPGTVNIVQTNSTVPNAGLTVCCPNADFVYNPKEFCKTPGAPNPIPTIKAGSVAGTFTCISANASTLIFANVTTGEINLAASAPGIYTIQNATAVTVDCTDPSKYTFDITIYGAPAIPPSISYALTTSVTFCNTDTAVKPVTLLNGVPGSNFYAVPNIGLNINAITGGITPSSSTPGTYVVHYKVLGQGNCADLDSVYTVSIISPPNVIQPANAVACGTYTLTAPANGVGTYYTTSGGIGTPVATGTVFTANQTLYLYATNGACSIEKTVTITINNTPVSIASVTAQPTCTIQSGTITVTGPTSPTVTLPTKLFISEVTDSATNALTYVELYNPTAAAINLSGYKLRIHDNGNTVQNTNCNSILSGTIQPNSTFVVKFTNNADIPGIVPPPTPYSNVLCGGIDTNDNIRLTTNTNVVIDVWGLTTGIPFTPLNQAGYTYRRLSNAGPIPNPDITATGWNPNAWLALDPEDYSDVGQYTFNTTNYLYNVDNGVFQSSLVFSGLTPGPHSIRVKNVSTGCISAPVTYTVDPLPTVLPLTAFTYPVTTICKNSTTTTLTPTATTPATFIAGGTYFATGTNAANLSINATTGEINIATSLPGTYSISYTVASPTNCYAPFVTLTINPVVTPVVGFSYSNANYCKNATNPSPITVTGFSTLGTFSVTPPTTLLSINATTGVINLSASTAGTYNVVYTVLADATTCRVQQVSLPVTVTIVNIITPVTGFSYAPSYCAGSTNPLPTLVSGFTPLGSFSAPAGLTINPTTGLINIASSTAGNYIVNYKVTADAATCRSFSENNFALTISSTVSPMISGECQGTAFVLTATPLNASYISTAVTYIWKNTATNTVVGTNLPTYTATQAGNYSVTVTNSLGCSGTALYTANEISCSIPKGISVNGDGINDTWDLTSLKAKEVTIYNRYGQKVYSKTNYTKEWTGQTDAGADLPDGTYFYVIERVGLDSISGWVYVNHALR